MQTLCTARTIDRPRLALKIAQKNIDLQEDNGVACKKYLDQSPCADSVGTEPRACGITLHTVNFFVLSSLSPYGSAHP